ncbi:MAG: type II CAAX endopeptidase family protein [Herbinix sp.]|nr:type II CAAX endopeptidase family protein [Herbinix sp.]
MDQFNTKQMEEQKKDQPNLELNWTQPAMEQININQYTDQPYYKNDYEIHNSKKIISRAGFALLILGLVVIGSQTVVDILINYLCPSVAQTDWYVWAITALSMVGIGFPIYCLMISRIPNSTRGEARKMSPLRFVMIFFICNGAMYITSFISSIFTVIIALLKGDTELLNPATEAIMNSNFVISLIYAAIIAPIIEELIFRKLLLDKLRRFGDIPAILMTGIAFGLFHMNLSQFFYAAVLGFIFAYVTIRTNTIKYSILLHMMINSLSTAFIMPVVINNNIIGSFIIILWIVLSITLGIIFFLVNMKKIKIEKSVPPIKMSTYFLNLGTILYTLFCFIWIIIVTIFY